MKNPDLNLSSAIPIKLLRAEQQFQAYLGFTFLSLDVLSQMKDLYLHEEEAKVYQKMSCEKKREDFLRGRYVAKKLLGKYLDEYDFTRIKVKSGVFHQPLVVYPTESAPGVSISHTQGCSASLVFSDEHPMGLDIEWIAPDAKKNILTQTTPHERSFYHVLDEYEHVFYTKLWTVKEALSKVLTTGLMTPFEIYQIDHMEQKEHCTLSTFTNFPQYKAISFVWKNYAFSLVLPQHTDCLWEQDTGR